MEDVYKQNQILFCLTDENRGEDACYF